MNQNATSDNDLQKAIDDITRSGGGEGGAVASEVAKAVETQATPVPVNVGASPAAYIPTDGQVPATEAAPVAPLAPVPAPMPAPVMAEEGREAMPVVPTEAEGFAAVKASALADLVPLIDKVELSSEEKFNVYQQVIAGGDKSLIPAAYVIAKEIMDERVRATALLFIINSIG